MKKFFVSTFVIGTFIAYSLYQRMFGQQASPIIVPQNITSNSTDTSQLTPPVTPTPTQSETPQPTQNNTPTATPTPTPKSQSQYKNGTFTGDAFDAFYGNIQVQAVITNGRITDVKFLQYPNDRDTSIAINSQADPMLTQEAISAQSAQVDIISGATDSSQAFVQSLQSALNKAKN